MSRRALRRLWLAFAVLAAFGSIYPFDFVMRLPRPETMEAFWTSCCGQPGRGDALGNIALFIPFGFLAMLGAWPNGSALARFFSVLAVGILFAFLLQVVQIWLPSRNENLQDIAWNALGAALGAGLAHAVRRYASSWSRDRRAFPSVILALLAMFLAHRLIPFVPTIDLKVIKESVRPLVLSPVLEPIPIAVSAVGWLVIAYLLERGLRAAAGSFPGVIAGVLALEVVIDQNTVEASDVAGAVIALALWWGILRGSRWQVPILAGLLIAVILASGLSPFSLRADPWAFYWMPFEAFLNGPMYHGTSVTIGKCFFYGALVFLLWQSGVGRVASIGFGVILVGAIEAAQTYVPTHTPEITDPILLAVTGLILALLSRPEDAQSAPGAHESRKALQH